MPKKPLDFPLGPFGGLKLDTLGVEIVGNGIGIGFDVNVIADGVADPAIGIEGCVGDGGNTNSVCEEGVNSGC